MAHISISRPCMRLVRALAVVSFLVAAGCADRSASQHEFQLRYASPYSPGHPFSRADKQWMSYLEERSGGRLRVQPFWGGSLVDEAEGVRELAAGIADVSFVAPIYTRAGMHFIRGQTPFYDGAVDMHAQHAVFMTLWNRFPQMRAEMQDVLPLVATGGSVQDIMTTQRPIRTLDDLKGLRLRAPMEVTELLEKLGVDAEFMPMGEVYTALAKGTIDGVVAPQDTLKAMRFAEVVKYCTRVSIGRGAYFSRAMNLQSWEKLPPDLRAIIEDSRAVWTEASIKELMIAAEAGTALGLERGVEFIDLPAADLQRLHELYAQLAATRADEMRRFGLPGEEAYRVAREAIAAWNAAQR